MSFMTDAWLSPNYRAFVAFCVHLEHKGKPLSMPLDIVEVAASHAGLELVTVFAKVLNGFGLADKVSTVGQKHTR
jgi:hypothetical protein